MKVVICCDNCGCEDLTLNKSNNPYIYKCKKCNTLIEIQENTFNTFECGDISDGYHTFNELYYHRMVLFSIVCNIYKEHAWKSWKHYDDTMYEDYFIVGVNTPLGQYSYHYHKDNWKYFDVIEKSNAPKWDGHKPEDIERLISLNNLNLKGR